MAAPARTPGDGTGTQARAPAARLPEADASLYLHPQTLARLDTFDLRAKMIVEGVMSGAHRSPHRGYSVEFAQHRPYVAGDDIRHLDWKVYARTDKLYLKQYEQETNLDLVLLVDCSGSMAFGSRLFSDASGTGQKAGPHGNPMWSKFDHATALAAALAYLGLKDGDRVGLGMFADHLHDALNRTSAMDQWRRIIGALSTHPVNRATDFPRVIDETLSKLHNRCLVVVVSDFFEDVNRVRSALARLRHRQHDVILCQVLDRQELTFSLDEEAPFEGLEGEGRLRIDPRAVRADYLKALRAHLSQIERLARGFGFDYLRISTSDWLGPPLAAFIARRNALIKRSKMA